jgi:hypothetical protein
LIDRTQNDGSSADGRSGRPISHGRLWSKRKTSDSKEHTRRIKKDLLTKIFPSPSPPSRKLLLGDLYMYLLNGLVLAMDDEMEDETGRLNLPARFSGLAVDSANEAPPLESRYSWAMEYEVGVTDQEDAERDRAKVRELQRISPVYWAAKTMLCSSQLKEHVRNTPELSRVLEERGFTYDVLKRMCYADQQFAVMVADKDMDELRDVIKRLKVDDANALFPDNVPLLPLGISPEQAVIFAS